MNILFITPRYPNSENGFANPFFKEQAESVSKTNNVIVVSADLNLNCFSILPKLKSVVSKKEGLTLHQLSICKSLPIYNSYNHARTALNYIGEILNNIKVDIVHCQNSFIAGFIGYLVNKRYGIPYVITQHSYFSLNNDKLLKSEFNPVFRSKIHELIIRKSFRNASKLIAVGELLKKELEYVFSRPVEVIPNVIDTNHFNIPLSNKGSLLKLGFVGNLLYNKGLDVLFYAIKKLKRKDFILEIVGEGEEKESLEKLALDLGIEDKISFNGYITPNDLPLFYNGLDVFILPSRRETFGVVVIEALASGVPVLTNPCGGPEFIINEKVGSLYNYCNSDDLANKLDTILNNLNIYNRDYIMTYAKENYSSKAFNEKITDLYVDVLKVE